MHVHSTNGMVEHATDPYSRAVARAAAQAATLAGTSIMVPPVPVSPSNNPGTSADGLHGVVETPPSPTNLVKGIHSHYIDGRAPTITWPNDVLTVLPFLDDSLGGNLLENDVDSVIQLLKSSMITFVSQVPYAQFFTKDNINSTTFLNDLRLVLAHGKIVILPKFQPDVTMLFSMEDIQLHLGLAPGLECSVHGKQQKPSVIYIYIYLSPRYADESQIAYVPPAEYNPRPVCGQCHQHFGYQDGSGPIFYPMLPHPQAYG